MSDESSIKGEMQFDSNNLYKEENITDLKMGNIQVITPIKSDGSPDESRETMFIANTTVMSHMGAIPIQGPIEASTLEEATAAFPDAIEKAIEKMAEEAQQAQREEANRIVTPGDQSGNIII